MVSADLPAHGCLMMPVSIGSIATIEAERGERVDEGHRWRGYSVYPRTCPCSSTTASPATETEPMASAALAWAFGQPMLRDSEPVLVHRASIQALVDALVAAREKLFYKNYYK